MEILKKIPAYSPSSKEDYFKRYVDVPDYIHEMVYTKATLKVAWELLKNRPTKKDIAAGSFDDLEMKHNRSPEQYIYDSYGLISD